MENRVQITKTPSWEIKLRAEMNKLSISERKVAAFIVSSGRELLELGISDIARKSGVSDATVVRLCRSLGYKGLKELKIAIAQESQEDQPYVRENRAVSVEDSPAQLKRKVMYACMEAIQDTMDVLDDKALEEAIEAMYAAKYIDIFGIGGSAAVARCAQHNFRKIGVRVNVCSDINQHYLLAERFSPGDVALGISLSGETEAVCDALDRAAAKGATTIGITGNRNSRMACTAHISLYSSSSDQLMPGDHTYERSAQLGIIDILFAGVAMKIRAEQGEAEARRQTASY
ncbi:MAG: MurR/RpiR family transcriptional regulator [Lachnospiraceae bacterium]|nr:MurR/RpiR family transcriptional regulator [Lachnospiraceae bacterium]